MSSLFGYNSAPTALWWIFYSCYWIIIALIITIRLREGTLFDADGALRTHFKAVGIRDETEEMEQVRTPAGRGVLRWD